MRHSEASEILKNNGFIFLRGITNRYYNPITCYYANILLQNWGLDHDNYSIYLYIFSDCTHLQISSKRSVHKYLLY